MNFKPDLIPQLQWNYGKLRIPSYLNILLPDISNRLYENSFQRWCRIIEIVPISHLVLRFVRVFDLLQFYWTRTMKSKIYFANRWQEVFKQFFLSSNESFNWIWDKRKAVDSHIYSKSNSPRISTYLRKLKMTRKNLGNQHRKYHANVTIIISVTLFSIPWASIWLSSSPGTLLDHSFEHTAA